MRIFARGCSLGAGGGLTTDSDISSENSVDISVLAGG